MHQHTTSRCHRAFADHNPAQNGPFVECVSASNPTTCDDQQAPNDAARVPAIPKFIRVLAGSKAKVSGSEDVTKDGHAWVVPGVGSFTKRAVYAFEDDTVPAGLNVSDYTVQCREDTTPSSIPYNERFDPANVSVSRGFLNLLVPGGQNPTIDNDYAVSCAEVTTKEENILYGSFRTSAIFSDVPGTCAGKTGSACPKPTANVSQESFSTRTIPRRPISSTCQIRHPCPTMVRITQYLYGTLTKLWILSMRTKHLSVGLCLQIALALSMSIVQIGPRTSLHSTLTVSVRGKSKKMSPASRARGYGTTGQMVIRVSLHWLYLSLLRIEFDH